MRARLPCRRAHTGGATATVFSGVDLRSNKKVAIKVRRASALGAERVWSID